MKWKLVLAFIIFTCFLSTSCNHTDGASETPLKTFSYWCSLPGTPVSVEIPIVQSDEGTPKNANPYFYAEVVETKEDYLVVKPRDDIGEKQRIMNSSAAELLRHSEQYIIPRVLFKGTKYLTDEDAAVGDIVGISFNDMQVYKDTQYGENPVIRIVFSCRRVSEEDITLVE